MLEVAGSCLWKRGALITLTFFYPGTLTESHGRLGWLWVGLFVSCKSGADLGMGWVSSVVIAVGQNKEINFV